MQLAAEIESPNISRQRTYTGKLQKFVHHAGRVLASEKMYIGNESDIEILKLKPK